MDQAMMQSTPEERMLAFVEAEDEQVQEESREGEHPRLKTAEGDIEQQEETVEQTEQRLLKLKYDGKEIEKPEDEVIDLAQQGFDYTQKTQKLADERRSIEQQAEAIKAQEQAFEQHRKVHAEMIQDIAAITAIDQQLAQYNGIDWQALSDSDPLQAQKLFFNMNQLQAQRGQLAQKAQEKESELTQSQQKLMAQRLSEAAAILDRDLPNWNTELKQTLIDTAKFYGASDQAVGVVTEPWIVKALADAAKWRKLQNSPTTQNKVSEAKPVVKPGSKDPKAAANSGLRETRNALRQTGKSDYAAKLIEKMI